MKPHISIIIPCFNAQTTIDQCLSAVYQSEKCNFELIVVDDHSSDNSLAVIRNYPCKIIELERHYGAAHARNAGAAQAKADRLFFTDADCVVQKKTLASIVKALDSAAGNIIIGGTYTQRSFDNRFFSNFQSIFIHYAETKHPVNPDYIATHALAMRRALFHQYAGFNNDVLPILEDVEYSHRLKKQGVKLRILPEIQVQHIFNFSLFRSIRNAIRKSRYWTVYSLENRDIFNDSGTASYELKVNTLLFIFSISLGIMILLNHNPVIIGLLLLSIFSNIYINSAFILSMQRSLGLNFTLPASLYYFCVYPIAIILGSLSGITEYLRVHYLPRETA